MNRSTHSKLSTMGVPLGVVTAKATASAPDVPPDLAELPGNLVEGFVP